MATPSIRAVFVANRGEIANRISRTCERLGIRVVVPETDGQDALDLLDVGAVVQAALTAGTDTVHPGFGFLAENAAFADAVVAAGLRWVGPPPAAIRAMGDKAAARRLAVELGVPVLAGYDENDQSDVALTAAAERIGFPLLVKPAAGGGGKGMRTVRAAGSLADSIASARREASAAFGDDRLILERLVIGARHVEIQVLFDDAGGAVHLGERDCSVQRRHQKVLEETPSPAVDPKLRGRLGEMALALGRAVSYVGAGTCEFLLDSRGEPSFLEMNTRLQVEHPVTEMVSGRDLVADQLAIAAGATLAELGLGAGGNRGASGAGGGGVAATGHAVEVRLYAEDADEDFLPATGRVETLRWPAGEGVRVDAGIALGSEIGGRFDPMLAKVIAWGPDRATAFARLARALDETVILGLTTNLRFLRWLVRQPVVLDGEARTDVLPRIWPPDDWGAMTAIQDSDWRVAAGALADAAVLAEAADTGGLGGLAGADVLADPWSGGWRLNAPRSIRVASETDTRLVELLDGSAPDPGATWVRVGESVHLDLAGRSVAFRIAAAPDVDASARAAGTRGSIGTAGPASVVAPMPGAVLTVHVAVGQTVVGGDPLVTLEAMKMEHRVTAPIDGTVAEVGVRPADQVTRGQLLVVVEP